MNHKKDVRRRLFTLNWWRRRDLNPRPKNLRYTLQHGKTVTYFKINVL